MANQDRVNFVWAESALTTIPPIPVSEVAYRDTTQTPEQMEVGQQYDTIYNSARHNQLLFLLTSVAKTLCENGIMPFLAGQEYSQYARCIFTDGKLYTASRAILANEQPYPTPEDDSGVWIAEETSENLVPNSRRVIAGTGLTGGGPLSADVTLAAKLTDSVSSTDSTTAASATAVKTAYDAAQAKLPLGGGVMTGSIQINDPANVIGSAPSTNTERGMFLGDKNSVIMGGVDVIQHASDNAKRAQMFAKNASGAIASIAAVMYEDGTREISTDCPMRLSDVQIERLFADSVRLIKFSGARGNEGLAMRYSPDSGELYLDGRAVHGKADTAVYADNAGTLGGKAESALSVAYARDSGAMNGKAESALSVAFASEAQNAYALKGMDMIIARTTYTLPGYGTWKYSFTVFDSSRFYDQVVGESPGGTTFSPVQMGWPEGSFMDGLAFRSA